MLPKQENDTETASTHTDGIHMQKGHPHRRDTGMEGTTWGSIFMSPSFLDHCRLFMDALLGLSISHFSKFSSGLVKWHYLPSVQLLSRDHLTPHPDCLRPVHQPSGLFPEETWTQPLLSSLSTVLTTDSAPPAAVYPWPPRPPPPHTAS